MGLPNSYNSPGTMAIANQHNANDICLPLCDSASCSSVCPFHLLFVAPSLPIWQQPCTLNLHDLTCKNFQALTQSHVWLRLDALLSLISIIKPFHTIRIENYAEDAANIIAIFFNRYRD